MGIVLKFSLAFYLATEGQMERTIETLEDMLRACVLDFQGSWEDNIMNMKISFNNSFHASIWMEPYEVLYGRKCRSLLYWSDLSDKWF